MSSEHRTTDPSNKDHLEVTIRAAMIIKTISGLIGAHDPLVMSLIVREAVDGIADLNTLIERMRGALKKARAGT